MFAEVGAHLYVISPPAMLRRLRSLTFTASFAFLVLTLFTAGGCTSGDVLVPFDDVDLDRLFAPPTAAERQVVQEEWAARLRNRAYDAGNVQVEYEGFMPDGSRLAILSHTTGGVPHTHYGAVWTPPGEPPENGWPVVLYNHGGAQGLDLSGTLKRFISGPLQEVGSSSMIVLPAFRSEPMTNTPIGDLISEGEPSIWDRDVDDALALLDATLDTYPELTDERGIATLGGSRGGAVALLIGLRDPRIRAVAGYYGPLDFFAPSVRSIAEQYFAGASAEDLAEELSLTKILPYMVDTVLEPLAAGSIPYSEARRELLRRSAAHFAYALPNTIAHHHGCDGLVPFEHFEALQANEDEMSDSSELYAYDPECAEGVYDDTFHSMGERAMPGSGERTAAFLRRSFTN